MREMTSGRVKVGEAVDMMVCEEIKDEQGHVLVSHGARASGKVTTSKRRGMLGKQGKLEFAVEWMEAINGAKVPLSAHLENSGVNNTGVVVATALLLSVLCVFVNGRDVTLKEGTEFVAYVERDTMIELAATPPSESAATAVTAAAKEANAPPAPPAATFTVLASLPAGTNLVGEIKNEGPAASGAEIIVLVRKDDKAVGAGTSVLDTVPAGEKRAFSIPIQGSIEGEITVQVHPKAVPAPPPAAPPAPPAVAVAPSAPGASSGEAPAK